MQFLDEILQTKKLLNIWPEIIFKVAKRQVLKIQPWKEMLLRLKSLSSILLEVIIHETCFVLDGYIIAR